MIIVGKGQDDEPIILEKVNDNHFLVHATGNPCSPFHFTETGADGTSVEECARNFIKQIGASNAKF
jgi:hypothetical protein